MGEGTGSEPQDAVRMESALRFYLPDRGADRPAWRYPRFLQGSETRGEVEIELEVEKELWAGFEEEAAAQGVSVEQLAEHAAIYFGAELDAGRLTERILADLESAKGDD